MPKIIEVKISVEGTSSKVGQLVWDDDAATGTRARMAFRYDPDWLNHGFALGDDLPLVSDILYPRNDAAQIDPVLRSRSGLFGFVADHMAGSWFSTIVQTAHLKGLKSKEYGSVETQRDLWTATNASVDRFSALQMSAILSKQRENDLLGEEEKTLEISPKSLSTLARNLNIVPNHRSDADNKHFAELALHAAPFAGNEAKLLVCKEKPHPKMWVVRGAAPDQSFNIPLWRAVTAKLAERCGLRIVESTMLAPNVYAESRLDRDPEGHPLYCASAATLVAAKNTGHSLLKPTAMSWLDVADILNREGAEPAADQRELFARLLFDSLTGNRRHRLDHIWFTRAQNGWRLLPTYCPCALPAFVQPRMHSMPVRGLMISADSQAVLSVSRYFGVKLSDAKTMRLEFMHALSSWKTYAQMYGADFVEMNQMQEAFSLF